MTQHIDVKIGERTIGQKHPTYVIAEIGLNHQGDARLAKRLIDESVAAGAAAVKFQKRSFKHLFKKDVLEHPERQEHGLSYSLEHVFRCELSERAMTELHRYAAEKNIHFLCTPWEEESLRFVSTLNPPAFKVGSPDLFNLPLLKAMAAARKPLIISTGMSFVSEIDHVIDFMNRQNCPYIMLHCNSTYPAPYHDINLNFIKALAEKTTYPVGYSGHERGISVCIAAVAMGAKVIERHITLDRNMPGPDHRASLEPSEFAEMIREIRILEQALGEPTRFPSRGEFLNRENLSKSLVAARPLSRGQVLRYEDITVKSPGKGTKPLKLDYFIGRKLSARDMPEGEYLLESDVDAYEWPTVAGLTIKHRWGVVVRLSDIDELLVVKPRFVEYRLTDADIKKNVMPKKRYTVELAVHAPEYHGDLLLDLSSQDTRVRKESVSFYNRALAYARKVKRSFKNARGRVKFVVHPGGYSMTRPLLEAIPELNRNLLDSLKKLNADGFELLIENMPSCPWIFGGQWYHSSFMDADEIAEFSRRTGYGIVFDISHAALYCNYYKKNLEEFTETILPVTKYVHISDAANWNGEGLKIGDGAIDFKKILPYLVKTDLWFLPEIWQGHKFGGEDFVGAIRSLKMINKDF